MKKNSNIAQLMLRAIDKGGFFVANGMMCLKSDETVRIPPVLEDEEVIENRKDKVRHAVFPTAQYWLRTPVRYDVFVAYQKYGEKLFDEGVEIKHLDGDEMNNLESNIVLVQKAMRTRRKRAEITQEIG